MIEPGADSGLPAEAHSISRYTLGFEKTFLDELASLEVRVPISGTYQFFSNDFGVRGSNAGDIALISKFLLTRTENFSSVVGLGLNLPTGTDVAGNIRDVGYTVQNETVHFVPYFATLYAPGPFTFHHFFVSGDYAANGNPVFASSFGDSNQLIGKLTDQTLLSFDYSMGRWLVRNPNSRGLTGVAAMAELHYVTTVTDADQIGTVIDTTLVEFGNNRNRSDVLNATIGLHFEYNLDTSLRVGVAFPLKEQPDRDFDAELLVQFIHRFGARQSRTRSGRAPSYTSTGDRVHSRQIANHSRHNCVQQCRYEKPRNESPAVQVPKSKKYIPSATGPNLRR